MIVLLTRGLGRLRPFEPFFAPSAGVFWPMLKFAFLFFSRPKAPRNKSGLGVVRIFEAHLEVFFQKFKSRARHEGLNLKL